MQMYKENNETTIAKRDYSFSMAYTRLSPKERREVREKVTKSLGITQQSFRLKRLGVVRSTIEQVDIIRDIFKQYNVEKVFNYEYAN